MENFNSTYVYLAFLALTSLAFLFRFFRIVFKDVKYPDIFSVVVAAAVVTISVLNINHLINAEDPVLIAEVDSEGLLREFIYSEARGSRPQEDREQVTAIYGRAFDLTINGLATENGWIIVPKDTAVVGVGARFDVTSLARKRLEDTLALVGYEYLQPETPAAAPEGANNE